MKILLTDANGYTGMRLLPKLLELGYTVVCVVRDVKNISIADPEAVLRNIWKTGGDNGWYYGSWVWKIRGLTNKFNGGVGLRRGRTHPDRISTGDALDFWRVLLADRENGRLLLLQRCVCPGKPGLNSGLMMRICSTRPILFGPEVFGGGYIGTVCCHSIISALKECFGISPKPALMIACLTSDESFIPITP